jgi:hypothetical protein
MRRWWSPLTTTRDRDLAVLAERGAVPSAFHMMVSTAHEGRIGEAGIVRPDGTPVRIHVTTAPHPDRPAHDPSLVRSVGDAREKAGVRTARQVLADWRQAERALESHAPGTPEHLEARRRVDALRAEYQDVTGRRPAGA